MPSGPGGDKQRLALASRCNYPSHGSPITAILYFKLPDTAVPGLAGEVDDDEIERFLFSG